MTAIHRKELFLASRIALIFTAMTFAFRASLEGVWSTEFSLTKEQLGWIFSPAFYGFTLAMIFGGPLADVLGMKRLLVLAFIGHIAGVIVYLVAKTPTMLFAGTLCIGIGNGMVEAACNPLTVALFPDNKTTMLNRFHVWFPGGIVIGGLISYVMIEQMHLDWRILIGVLFIPAIIYGFLFLKLKFPPTERVTRGVSTRSMFAACLSPLFLIMLACMFLTAATELGTNQWLGALLSGAGVSGILVLVFINGLMAVGRSFAGTFVHRLNPNGMLILSALLACIGLLLLSRSSGYAAFGACVRLCCGHLLLLADHAWFCIRILTKYRRFGFVADGRCRNVLDIVDHSGNGALVRRLQERSHCKWIKRCGGKRGSRLANVHESCCDASDTAGCFYNDLYRQEKTLSKICACNSTYRPGGRALNTKRDENPKNSYKKFGCRRNGVACIKYFRDRYEISKKSDNI
jgi:MFS family permease